MVRAWLADWRAMLATWWARWCAMVDGAKTIKCYQPGLSIRGYEARLRAESGSRAMQMPISHRKRCCNRTAWASSRLLKYSPAGARHQSGRS